MPAAESNAKLDRHCRCPRPVGNLVCRRELARGKPAGQWRSSKEAVRVSVLLPTLSARRTSADCFAPPVRRIRRVLREASVFAQQTSDDRRLAAVLGSSRRHDRDGARRLSALHPLRAFAKPSALVELIVFGGAASFFLLLTHNRLTDGLCELGFLEYSLHSWALLIFVYAFFIPNTWQRAVVVRLHGGGTTARDGVCPVDNAGVQGGALEQRVLPGDTPSAAVCTWQSSA